MMRRLLWISLVLVVSLGTRPARADEAETSPYRLSLYGWGMGIRGELESPDGTLNEFTVPFQEIFQRLKGVLQASAEVRQGRWYAIFDGTWAKLGGGYEGDLWKLDVDLDQQIYDFKVGRSLYQQAETWSDQDEGSGWVSLSGVDLLLGARYFGSQTTLTETLQGSGQVKDTMAKSSRWDPIIGLRGAFPLGRRWSATVIGDMGGFGIGSAARFTYQVDANLAYRFKPAFSAFAGYRVLGSTLEQQDGSENTITQNGPRVGVALSF